MSNKSREYSKNYVIIKHSSQYGDFKSYIDAKDYGAFDTETTGLNVRKDKVIGFSYSNEPGTGYYFPLYFWANEKLNPIPHNIDNCKSLLNLIAEKELLMWNASFDVRMVKNNLGIDLLPSLVADGVLLKHTIEEDGKFGLKESAIQLQSELGLNVEEAANKEQIEVKQSVEANGGSTTMNNFEMFKADLDILGMYGAADADLTLRICEYYNDRLVEEGLEELFYDKEVMPLYKEVTVSMESHGVKLDMDLLLLSKDEIEKDMASLESDIIRELFETEGAYNWYRDTVEASVNATPSGSYVQGVAEYYHLDLPKTKAGKYSTSKSNVAKLKDSEAKQFLLGELKSLDPDIQFEIKENIYLKKSNNILMNISSKKQLGEIVFKYMNIKPLSKTDKGNPQFNDGMVDYLASEKDFEWAKKLSNYNKLTKIKGTYIDRFLSRQEDGYYYFSYKQHGTISGRFGSDSQQLPRPLEEGQADEIIRKYNNRIRAFFISGEGRKFIDCDYESLEPHIFASVSGDEGLIDIFKKGHDFYSTIAIATESLEGVSADKKADNYLGKVNKELRQKSKEYCLGVPYGLRSYALSKKLGIEEPEAQQLIDNYFGAYPELKRWVDRSKNKARQLGYVESLTGRKRHLPKVKKIYSVHKDRLMDFKYRKKLERKYGPEKVLELYLDYKNGINNSINFQIQSTAASIVNMSAIEINRYFNENKIDAWVCANIHDQLIVNVPEELAEELAEVVKNIMENVIKLNVTLKAPPSIADNWKDGH